MGTISPDQLPPGLIREVCEALERHGHPIPPTDVLPVLMRLVLGGDDRWTSTRLIMDKVVATYLRPPDAFTRGERHGRIDDLHLITGEGHSGILQRAEQLASRHQ